MWEVEPCREQLPKMPDRGRPGQEKVRPGTGREAGLGRVL